MSSGRGGVAPRRHGPHPRRRPRARADGAVGDGRARASAASARARTTRRASGSGRSPARRTPTPTSSSRAAATTAAHAGRARAAARAHRHAFGMKMDSPMNAGPQQHYVLQAALEHLDRWAAGGAAAAERAASRARGRRRRERVRARRAGQRARRRAHAVGRRAERRALGARPERRRVRVPVRDDAAARSADARARLYPGGRADYLARFAKATDEAVGRASCSRRIARRSARWLRSRPGDGARTLRPCWSRARNGRFPLQP